ncbi:MAG TPA: YggT family protein [Candidatus Competibacteraceae bacterium]|nr:YggT family protein [Candidatus Competibacteraceae bacterium]
MDGTPYLSNAGAFLIQTLFGFYILLVMLRFLLQWVRADFYNPLVQFLVRLTNPPLVPLRRLVPGLLGLDMAAVVLMVALQLIELLLLLALDGRSASPGGLLVLSLAELLGLLVTVYFWGIIVQAVMSWINPDPRHPLLSLLWQLTAPLLRPARRLLPPVVGIDLSPILVLIALQLLNLLLVAPLRDAGYALLGA